MKNLVPNSHPLTPLSNDLTDLNCLAPAHFLIGRPLISLPDPDTVDKRLTRCQLFHNLNTNMAQELYKHA